MELSRLIDDLNKATNILDSLRAKLSDEGYYVEKPREAKKTKSKRSTKTDPVKPIEQDLDQKTELYNSYKILLTNYKLPVDDDFIRDIDKIVVSKGITANELDGLFSRISKQNEATPIRDIKKYVYGGLHKIKDKAYNN